MINVIITDSDALAAISHERIAEYLEATGWQLQEVRRGVAAHWKVRVNNTRFKEFRKALGWDGTVWAIAPAVGKLADYVSAVQHLIETVAKVEQRSQLDVLVDLGGDLGAPQAPATYR